MPQHLYPLLTAVSLSILTACGGSSSSSTPTNTTPPAVTQCNDKIDNDLDGSIDDLDPGCLNPTDDDETDPPLDSRLSRYQMSNSCWVVKANGNGNYLVADESGYIASATSSDAAEAFYMKPTALGKYMFYNTTRQVIATGTAPQLSNVASASADDSAEWQILATADVTSYPITPAYNVEPTPEQVSSWHNFIDPQVLSDTFTISAGAQNLNLAIDDEGRLHAVAPASKAENESFTGRLHTVAPASTAENESFTFEPATGCANFPEAQSNFRGQPFKGTQEDGTVLGHADVHVHISATEFLGGAHWGRPFHKFGVEQALGNCSTQHGEDGRQDVVGGAFGGNIDGHATDGWPTFSGWPKRNDLIHEAIYWKWLERAWAGGLRVVVNELVDNETLCELQRNVSGEANRDCNSMNNAGRQAGTMYAMENYIDAQYGGPGKGFFQIVHTSDEARAVIEEGHIAVILGIEISNLFDCKIKYNPSRQQRPFEEDGLSPLENSYGCAVAEGKPNSILTQMKRTHDWGVRKIISIHEFDNAFGGNGIFDGQILNIGNRENSGGIPSGDLAAATQTEQLQAFVGKLTTTGPESATGEWWTTYDCPIENKTPGFSGYLWGNSGGSAQDFLPSPPCESTGQDGRAGGTTPCYPAGLSQCNARWMTPAGLYTYSKMMEMGFIFDWDHMELGMKTQALELAEAQDPVYPFVSTHGTFGGTTIDQATRLIANGGILYPSNGSSTGFREDMSETAGIYINAMAKRAAAGKESLLFGFGYGTDTNGLSGQTSPRDNPENPIGYPFTLFGGAPFSTMTEFNGVNPVVFDQPNSLDADGNEVRVWREDLDGNAHYGMLSDFVKEVTLDSQDPNQTRHLFNSAEVFLQTWKRTELAHAAIQATGLKSLSASAPAILRAAPPIGDYAP